MKFRIRDLSLSEYGRCYLSETVGRHQTWSYKKNARLCTREECNKILSVLNPNLYEVILEPETPYNPVKGDEIFIHCINPIIDRSFNSTFLPQIREAAMSVRKTGRTGKIQAVDTYKKEVSAMIEGKFTLLHFTEILLLKDIINYILSGMDNEDIKNVDSVQNWLSS